MKCTVLLKLIKEILLDNQEEEFKRFSHFWVALLKPHYQRRPSVKHKNKFYVHCEENSSWINLKVLYAQDLNLKMRQMAFENFLVIFPGLCSWTWNTLVGQVSRSWGLIFAFGKQRHKTDPLFLGFHCQKCLLAFKMLFKSIVDIVPLNIFFCFMYFLIIKTHILFKFVIILFIY